MIGLNVGRSQRESRGATGAATVLARAIPPFEIRRRMGGVVNLDVTLIIDHNGSKLGRASIVQVRLSQGDGHSQFAGTAMALRAGRPRKGIT
jgi:hypothetical protein